MSNIINFISQPIYNILIFLYSILWNDLGLAIIVLTVLIKLIFIPLSKKQIESQKELQKVQPKIKEIQEKYKDDKETQSRKMIGLYKEHKINPAAGCLPLIIQMVVFISLYRTIMQMFSDNLQIHLDNLYSFIPHQENIGKMFIGTVDLSKANIFLAIVTAGLQFYQIKMMQQKNKQNQKPVNNNQNDSDKNSNMTEMMNKQMLFIIPLIILWSGMRFPSGLTLYWLVSTLFAVIQQWFLIKKDEK